MSDLSRNAADLPVAIIGSNTAGVATTPVGSDISGNLLVRDAANGTDGATAPALATQIAGKDGSGNLQTLSTDTSGAVFIIARSALTPSAATSVSVGVASTTVLASNANRKGLVVTNISNAKISFNLLGGSAVINTGVTLYPGWIWEMDAYTFTTNGINAISSAASSIVTVQEFS